MDAYLDSTFYRLYPILFNCLAITCLCRLLSAAFYILTLTIGYLCLLAAGVWISRLLKNNLLDDVFNNENESFMQKPKSWI